MLGRREFAQLNWITSEGHAPKTTTLRDVTGKCKRIDVIISSVTANPTVIITITDTTYGGTYVSLTGLADGTHHIKLSESSKRSQNADFNTVPFMHDNLTISIDPSADAGGSGQTLTVDVILVLEEDG